MFAFVFVLSVCIDKWAGVYIYNYNWKAGFRLKLKAEFNSKIRIQDQSSNAAVGLGFVTSMQLYYLL
jgi:hypothetical protein